MLIGISFFIVYLLAFILGLRHGKQLSKGITPNVEINPVKAYTEHKKRQDEKTKEDLITEGLTNILNYDGRPPKGVSK